MDLKEILNISGKPGLYKIVAQSAGRIIVESLEDGKRVPVFATNNFSILKDISIFTLEEDLPLESAFKAIYEHEKGAQSVSHKESDDVIKEKMAAILPTYDKEQVRPADMKKLFKWYNLLIEKKAWTPEDISSEEESEQKIDDKPKSKAKPSPKSGPRPEKKTSAPKGSKAATAKTQKKGA